MIKYNHFCISLKLYSDRAATLKVWNKAKHFTKQSKKHILTAYKFLKAVDLTFSTLASNRINKFQYRLMKKIKLWSAPQKAFGIQNEA